MSGWSSVTTPLHYHNIIGIKGQTLYLNLITCGLDIVTVLVEKRKYYKIFHSLLLIVNITIFNKVNSFSKEKSEHEKYELQNIFVLWTTKMFCEHRKNTISVSSCIGIVGHAAAAVSYCKCTSIYTFYFFFNLFLW